MAIRIQLRRDTAANWVSSNPTLREGELGIETDTLKIKIGNGSAWNSISNYANVVPSDLSTTLGDYVTVSDIGAQGGVVGLNSSYNAIIPGSSIIIEGVTGDAYETTLTVTDPTADRTITLPDADGTVALTSNLNSYATLSGATFTGNINVPTAITFEGATADSYETTIQATDPTADRTIILPDAAGTVALTSNIPSTTDTLSEGTTNLYFTDERAQDAAYTALSNGTHTNISVSYNDSSNAISLTGAVTYTDENAQDAVGNAVGTGLSYNDSTGAISVDTTAIQTRVSDVSDTEIGYLNGVTSAIQTQIDNKLALSGGTMTGLLTLSGLPESSNHAATKAYVDNISAGLNFHAAVHAATTANLSATYDNGAKTLTGSGAFPQIDSHTVSETERVLVKSQNDAKENGIYTLTDDGDPSGSWVLTRAADADNTPSGEIAYGDFTFVQNGTTNGGFGFIMTTTGTITLGSSNINYTQFNTGQAIIAGNGLSEPTAGTLAINTAVTVDVSTAQTLTNKTLTSPKLNEDVALTATATELNTLDGITASTAELNILDGATLSTTELNYVDGVTSAIQTQLNAKQAIVSGVSDTEIGYLDGVTSAIQTQLDAKLATSTAASTYQPLVSGVSDTEIGYLDGVTSSIQTQLDAKIAKSLVDAKGDLLVGTADNTVTRLGVGTDGYLLTADSSVTNGVKWAAAPVSLPSQTDQSGKYLTTDGSTASWASLVVPITTGTATVTGNTATTVDTTALSAFTSIEYMVSLKQGSKIRTSKVVVQTDGTSVDMTEFAITETGGTIAGVVVSAAVSSTNCVLQVTATDGGSTNVTVKFSKVKL
jgi:hypothetical protein